MKKQKKRLKRLPDGGRMRGIMNKAILAVLLFALMAVSVPFSVSAAGKTRLEKEKMTLYAGKTAAIRLLNNSKKVSWSSTDSKVVKITSKSRTQAKIKALKKGTAYVKAKAGNRTYKCKVTVQQQKKRSMDGIEYELQDTGDGVVAILKNNNKYHVSLSAKLVYYRNNKMIQSVSDSNYALEKGRTCALFFRSPYDSNYRDVDYDSYKISISAKKTPNLICGASKIKVTSDFGDGNVTAKVKNNSGKDLSYICMACVFYDSHGKAIGYDYTYADCGKKGSTDYVTFHFPYDDNYKTIYPKSYKIYVNRAYTYT